MALPAVLLKAKNAISKGVQAAKTAEAVKSATSNSNEEEVKSFFSIFKLSIIFLLPIIIFLFIVFIMVIAIPQVLYADVFGNGSSDSGNGGSSYTGDIGYLQWAIDIANDDTHGYSQCHRNGPDYDCASLVYYSLLNNGYSQEALGGYAFNVTREIEILPKIGFVRHDYVKSELQAGDILIRDGHTGIYAGNEQVVQASSSREGNGICGETGDFTGTEVWVSDNSGNWTSYYRKEG